MLIPVEIGPCYLLYTKYATSLRSVIIYALRFPNSIPTITDVETAVLAADINPGWANTSSFIPSESYVSPDDSIESFTANPTKIPASQTPFNTNSLDYEHAQDTITHYSPTTHLGLMVADQGFVDMASIRARRLPSGYTDKFSQPFNFSISPTRSVARCAREDITNARTLTNHFAKCGITIEEVESAVRYALQAQKITFFPDYIRRAYAEAFHTGQLRMFFFSLPQPINDTYTPPEHWNLDHILKYRRQAAVVRYWKETKKPGLPQKFDLPVMRHSASSDPDASIADVSSMTISDPSPADQPTPGPIAGSVINLYMVSALAWS
ncbi:hypothetical protein Moror_8594 [Moniliophthora roreri MCA 2997]|uniref:Uncharacterized protein n=1 Tax=Moniliophthora roreri (strain MCA 2997) TaxID=1381753 RepID=V2XA72_MONRO|nr:hypothetical protein Moror_8594 [Moniliophthora roreri MCA 2997]